MYRYEGVYLDDNVILCQFNKPILVGSSLGPRPSPVMSSWPGLQSQHPHLWIVH